MRDAFGREIDYLRISVTDRCNLRCLYCQPEKGVELKEHDEILRYEELLRVVRVAVDLGFRRFRITGGEPLVRAGIDEFCEALAKVAGVEDLSLTTNGIRLPAFAVRLKEAGVRRVNVSLDTLRPDRFRLVTRREGLDRVLEGIDKALEAGLQPLKINVVVIRGFNDDEIPDFVRMADERPVHVRFIELMPLGEAAGEIATGFIPAAEMQRMVPDFSAYGRVAVDGYGPADYYQRKGSPGTLGFITAISRHFCSECNRMRLTADGRLNPCLASDGAVELKTILRSGGSDDDLREAFRRAIGAKPEAHRMGVAEGHARSRMMSGLGG